MDNPKTMASCVLCRVEFTPEDRPWPIVCKKCNHERDVHRACLEDTTELNCGQCGEPYVTPIQEVETPKSIVVVFILPVLSVIVWQCVFLYIYIVKEFDRHHLFSFFFPFAMSTFLIGVIGVFMRSVILPNPSVPRQIFDILTAFIPTAIYYFVLSLIACCFVK